MFRFVYTWNVGRRHEQVNAMPLSIHVDCVQSLLSVVAMLLLCSMLLCFVLCRLDKITTTTNETTIDTSRNDIKNDPPDALQVDVYIRYVRGGPQRKR